MTKAEEKKPTKEEFRSYLIEQATGTFNMISENARLLTGLDKPTYYYIFDHYGELEEEYGIHMEDEDIQEKAAYQAAYRKEVFSWR